MPGLYNNESGSYEDVDWLGQGDWFDDREGFLYIVPMSNVVSDCEGPDNETMDAINAACRDHDRLTDADVERLGLIRIPDGLKRFDSQSGYYHA